jgi:hypothetical protein
MKETHDGKFDMFTTRREVQSDDVSLLHLMVAFNYDASELKREKIDVVLREAK